MRKISFAKILALLLALLVLAGCGSSAASSSAAPTADSAAATADTAAVDQLAQIKERGTIIVAMEGNQVEITVG